MSVGVPQSLCSVFIPPSASGLAGQGSLWLFRHRRSSDSTAGPLLSDPSSLAAAVPQLRECGQLPHAHFYTVAWALGTYTQQVAPTLN